MALTYILCTGNKLTCIDTSTSPKLTSLYCDDSVAEILCPAGDILIDAKHFPDTRFRDQVSLQNSMNDVNGGSGCNFALRAQDIAKITSLNLGYSSTGNLKGIEYLTALRNLDCSNRNLVSLDVSKNVNLQTLNCANNKLTSLKLGSNKNLTTLDCSYNALKTLDIRGCPNLKNLIADSSVKFVKMTMSGSFASNGIVKNSYTGTVTLKNRKAPYTNKGNGKFYVYSDTSRKVQYHCAGYQRIRREGLKEVCNNGYSPNDRENFGHNGNCQSEIFEQLDNQWRHISLCMERY